jgi:hydroxymethylglutaryl-CoA reductase (NADPH)
MQFIPKSVLSKLYNRTSLRNDDGRVRFSIKNRLSPAKFGVVSQIAINGEAIPAEKVMVAVEAGEPVPLTEVNKAEPADFSLGTLVNFYLDIDPLPEGNHEISMAFDASPFGRLNLEVVDALKSTTRAPGAIPRDVEDDYSDEIIQARQAFIREQSGAELKHISSYAFDPQVTRGNIEHFTGAAQVPLGFAGPLLVHGEHAKGEFYVPLAWPLITGE